MTTDARKRTEPGAGRAKRREDMAAFRTIQCKQRDAAPGHRLPGDAPDMQLPSYYINYLKRDSHDRK